MVWNKFTKRTVNVIIKDHVIRYLESKQPDINAVLTFGERYLPPGVVEEGKIIDKDRLQSILQECVTEWNLKKCEVQFLAPDPAIVVRKIDIPVDVKDEEIKGYLYLELGTTIHLPFDNPIFTTEILGEHEGKKEILLFAAPESLVLEYTTLFEKVGLTPTVADLSPLAIYRLYYKLHIEKENTEEAILSVQFDQQTVTASIFKNHKLIFVRHLKLKIPLEKWQHVQDDKRSEITWGGEEDSLLFELQEMIEEIERILNFYMYSLNKGSEGIKKLLLTGDHPYMEEITEMLERTIEGEIIRLDLDNTISSLDSTQTILDSRFHLVLGLSLKGGI